MKTLYIMSLFILITSHQTLAKNKQNLKEILIDNEKIQLVRLTYPPGTESGMHTHEFAHRTVYFIKGGQLQLIPKNTNEAIKTLTVADGKSLYMPATTHNVKNIGLTEIVILETEIK